jgi:hypothetical protein
MALCAHCLIAEQVMLPRQFLSALCVSSMFSVNHFWRCYYVA